MRPVTSAALAGVLILCATSPLAAPAPSDAPEEDATASAEDVHDVQAREVLSALQAGDFAGVGARFNARMRAALSDEQLAQSWQGVLSSQGPLKGAEVVERRELPGVAVRVLRLDFERSDALLQVALEPGSRRIAGLHIRPARADEAGASGTVPTSAPYVDPRAFRAEDVRFGEAPFTLSGTLTVPVSRTRAPAVVLLHGSGPNDRDGTVGGVRPLKDLAEGLSSRGFVVLRYDKRTLTHAARLSGDIGLEEEVLADAVAAVDFLRRRPEVDGRRLFVVGHSLGALLAPEVAVRAGRVAGVVLLAPPGRPPWELVLAQLRAVGTPPEQLTALEAQAAQLSAGTLPPTTRFAGAPASYWRDWARRDGVAMARRLRRPVLVLRGERDYQVTEEDLARWRRGLARVRRAEVETVPGANHLFVAGTGPSTPDEYRQPGHVDARVLERLVRFLRRAPRAQRMR